MIDLIDVYKEEKQCCYRGEEYLVRDNGAVLRKPKPDLKKRKWDNVWTFGTINKSTNYLTIVSVPIHRIVATAFLGDPPTEDYVVDHIDTNRHNNRPNNLRWVTRFENLVNNPISRKKIEKITGVSIFDFLKNPNQYLDAFKGSDFHWMRTVSEEEARNCLENLQKLSKRDENIGEEKRDVIDNKVGLGEWIYGNNETSCDDIIIDSLTPYAKQKNWLTLTIFNCCPDCISDNPIDSYYANLSEGIVFSQNQYGYTEVLKYAMCDVGIIVEVSGHTQTVKGYYLCKITFENDSYIHENLGSYFTEEGADKQFILCQGKEWSGGDIFDDFVR